MTTPALAEVTEELVSALRRALSILEEAAAVAALPVPREPETTQDVPQDAPQDAPEEPAADELGDRVRAALAADTVRQVLQTEVLADADPAVAARVQDKIEALRRDVILQVDNIPFDDELKWTLALSYLEIKAQWLQRQVRVCYEEMITGTCSAEVALEASASSYLLGLLEPLLDADDLVKIQELFASQTG